MLKLEDIKKDMLVTGLVPDLGRREAGEAGPVGGHRDEARVAGRDGLLEFLSHDRM